MIRVLIVEDSVTQREIFRRLLTADGEFEVVAEARNGREALAKVQQHAPDVVLMDIHMPEMDGITATQEIMIQCPVPIVVVSGTLKKRDVNLAMKAYEAGAVSVIEKPEGAVLLHLHKMAPELRRELIAASKANVRRIIRPLDTSPALPVQPQIANDSIRVIGVCASTGGPPVLLQIFSALPKSFPIPILLVQHISRGFEDGFAQWLSHMTGQPVAIAGNAQRLMPGIWMAPGGRHLTLGSTSRIDMPVGAPSEIHCPSGNSLFNSLARHAGPKAAGILLTGMGDDGATGLLSLKQAGGMTIIQEESSCLIWGMPKAARQTGAATYELKPGEIANTLVTLRT
jgi:two-component system chemotaxis response regulator CheB